MIVLPFIFMTGCEEYEMGNPLPSTIADFSYTVGNDGYAPAEVTFTNKSLNATGYHSPTILKAFRPTDQEPLTTPS